MNQSSNTVTLRKDGQFPVSLSGFWHGRIHINGKESTGVLHPVIEGKIAALSIQEEYCQEPFLPELTETEYDNLLPGERPFYKMDDSKGIYILTDQNKPLRRDYSTSYVMLEHSVQVPIQKNGRDEQLNLNFFSLYMHLRPQKPGNCFEEIESLELPFYLEWDNIKITETRNTIKAYHPAPLDEYLYDGTKYSICEPTCFYRDFDIDNRNTVTIESKFGTREMDPTDFTGKPAVLFRRREAL